jgi:hypothetical protein
VPKRLAMKRLPALGLIAALLVSGAIRIAFAAPTPAAKARASQTIATDALVVKGLANPGSKGRADMKFDTEKLVVKGLSGPKRPSQLIFTTDPLTVRGLHQ